MLKSADEKRKSTNTAGTGPNDPMENGLMD